MILSFLKKNKEVAMAESKITVDDINRVNEALKTGGTLNKLEKTEVFCFLSRKAFKSNALKLGYEYKDNTFVLNENIQTEHRSASSVKISNPKTKRSEEKLIETKPNKDELSETKQTKANDTEDILIRFSEFDDRLKTIEHILSNSNLAKSDFILNPEVLEGDVINRSMKASKTILEAFDKLCEKKHLAAYTKQALLGQALLEFIEKYK